MLLKWLIYAVVLYSSPVLLNANSNSRSKRSEDSVPCERGWFHYDGKCYKAGGKRSSEVLTWENAVERCKSEGGNLASIHSQEEFDFIVTFLLLDLKSHTWIGLNDRTEESVYVWSDGSNFSFQKWKDKEPTGTSDENEDCVHMWFQPEYDFLGDWNDIRCDNRFAYICQKDKNENRKSADPLYCSSAEGGGWKFQSSCYHVLHVSKSWKDAEQHCKDNYNGHLTTILDTTVDYFLDYILSNLNKEFWIGIKTKEQFQQKWTSGWHVSYNGMTKEGDFANDTCVLRKQRKEWSVVLCSRMFSFICEITKVRSPVLKPPLSGSSCPNDLYDWRDLGGEYCYYIQNEKSVSWYEASLMCNRRGGDLLSLHSKDESDILFPFVRYTRQVSYHIGLVKLLSKEETFRWTDGSKYDYENWGNGEPNNGNEKCTEIVTLTIKWNDENCETEKRGYICSVKKILPISMTEKPPTNFTNCACPGCASSKALIGGSVCAFLLVMILGVVVFYFRRRRNKQLRNLTAASKPPPLPSDDRPRYSRTRMRLEGQDEDGYECML